jgi:hypothetical protein
MLDLGSIWLRAGMDVGSAAQVRTHKVMLHTAQSKFQQGPLEMETASPAPKEHPRTPPTTTNICHHGLQKLKSQTQQVGRNATQMASPVCIAAVASPRMGARLPSRRSSPSAVAALSSHVTLCRRSLPTRGHPS